jgi:hypothetical protein
MVCVKKLAAWDHRPDTDRLPRAWLTAGNRRYQEISLSAPVHNAFRSKSACFTEYGPLITDADYVTGWAKWSASYCPDPEELRTVHCCLESCA